MNIFCLIGTNRKNQRNLLKNETRNLIGGMQTFVLILFGGSDSTSVQRAIKRYDKHMNTITNTLSFMQQSSFKHINRTRKTYLFLALEFVLDLPAEHRQQNSSTLGQLEQLGVDHILDAGHLGLIQPSGRDVRDDVHDSLTQLDRIVHLHQIGRDDVQILQQRPLRLQQIVLVLDQLGERLQQIFQHGLEQFTIFTLIQIREQDARSYDELHDVLQVLGGAIERFVVLVDGVDADRARPITADVVDRVLDVRLDHVDQFSEIENSN